MTETVYANVVALSNHSLSVASYRPKVVSLYVQVENTSSAPVQTWSEG